MKAVFHSHLMQPQIVDVKELWRENIIYFPDLLRAAGCVLPDDAQLANTGPEGQIRVDVIDGRTSFCFSLP